MSKSEFQDHYAILGVKHGATSEEIATAYQKLARELHPNTPRTGDRAMFAKVNAAYEVLSDPAARQEFDKLFSKDAVQRPAAEFSGDAFFEAIRQEGTRRMALLCVLYDHRRRHPARPSLSYRELEQLLAMSTDEMTFTLWFLKQRNLASVDDKSSVQITADGMEYLEGQALDAAGVGALIRPKEG